MNKRFIYLVIIFLSILSGCSNNNTKKNNIKKTSTELLKHDEKYKKTREILKDELLKVDETIHYINKIYNQKKDSENSWFFPDEYVLIKDKYNDRVFEYYGYTEDEGISVNNMEKIIEMKQLKEIKDEINILLNKTEYSFAEIMIAEKIESRILELNSPEHNNKSIVISAVKREIYDRKRDSHIGNYIWGKSYDEYHITNHGNNSYNSFGKVKMDGAEYDFNIDVQVVNGLSMIETYSLK